MKHQYLVIFSCTLAITACTTTKDPVLYPNEKTQQASDAQIDQDIKECAELAERAGAKSNDTSEQAAETTKDAAEGAVTGGATGAVTGNAGVGAATGAISRGLNRFFASLDNANEPSAEYKRIVERCLVDKGYEPIGWE